MVEDVGQEAEFEDAGIGICAACGHEQASHVIEDTELPGETRRVTYCEACEDFHEFVADPRDRWS